jgi:voltage-gated potassium channel Kch
MLNINVTAFAAPVLHQRRFRYLFMGLVGLSLLLGLVVVPVERVSPENQFAAWHDGLWWAAITVMGVGYGDIVPVTFWGRLIGLILAGVGVTAYGLIVGMFTIALDSTKDKYYRSKMEEQLTRIDERLERIEKHGHFLAQKELKKK